LAGTSADQLEKLLSSCLSQSLSETPSQIESVVINEEKNTAVVTFKTASAAKQCVKLGQVVSFGRVLQIRGLSDHEDSRDLSPEGERELRAQSNISFSSFSEMADFFSAKSSVLAQLDSTRFKQVNILLSVNVLGTESQVKKTQRNMSEAFGHHSICT